tara:strand:+ start:31790 stop:32614 length:825 start_codon:yes stop_codon:yes gene_type:complete
MITISYMAMGILIATINCLLLIAIALFLILYLKNQKDVSSIKQWTNTVAHNRTTRIDELKSLLASGLQLDEAKKSEVAQTLSDKETELYTLIAETYINRDNCELLSLDNKVETLFKVYIDVVMANATMDNNLAEDNKQIMVSLRTIFTKYMLATGTKLDESQEYSVDQILELVEQNDINKSNVIIEEDVSDKTDIPEIERTPDAAPKMVEPAQDQILEGAINNEPSQVVEQIEVLNQPEDKPEDKTVSEIIPEASLASSEINKPNDNLDENPHE